MNLLEKLDMLKARTGDNNHTLAEKANIPYTTIDGLYKKGYKGMRLTTLEALCNYFNVPLDFLAKDDGEKYDYTQNGIAARKPFAPPTDPNITSRLTHLELVMKKAEETQGYKNLTPDEEDLIEDYRLLTKKDKLKARRILAALADKNEGL